MIDNVTCVASADPIAALMVANEARALGFPCDWVASGTRKGYRKAVARAMGHELAVLIDEGVAIDTFTGERFDLAEASLACVLFSQMEPI